MTSARAGATEVHPFDVAIVGGGPAGLTAAIWLARYLRSVVLIDSGDPRNWQTRGIHGFLGQPDVKPAELRGSGRDECREYGVELIDDEVDTVTRAGEEIFDVALCHGRTVHAKRLLLAIGIKDIWPETPGLERCYGESAHVCPDCDGYEARGKKTVVIGTGRRAVAMALALLTWTREIIICTNGEPDDLDAEMVGRLKQLNIPILCERIEKVASDPKGDINCVTLDNGMQLDCERIFFALGQYPADDLGAKLGCKRDSLGRITIDERNHTSVEHVYAAGDITPGPQLAIAAAAWGAIAALAIHKSLLPEEQLLPD